MVTLDPNEDQGEDGDAEAPEPTSPEEPEETPPPPPPPPKPSGVPYVYSGYYEYNAPLAGVTAEQVYTGWRIYVAFQTDPAHLPAYNPWDKSSLVFQGFSDKGGIDYPIKIGPFPYGDWVDCYYERSSDDEGKGDPMIPGSIECSRGTEHRVGLCVDDEAGRQDSPDKYVPEGTWSPQAICTIEGELPAPGDPELEDHDDNGPE